MADELLTIPDMLHWYDGMLLLPEHFQAAHRRHEMLVGYLARTVAPHGWGVKSLKAGIAGTKLAVLELEAVMPDGLAFHYRVGALDKGERPLEVDLADKKPLLGQRKRLMVHLLVTAWSDDCIVEDGPVPGRSGRYMSVKGAPLERDDPDTGKADPAAERMHERPWLRPILELHVGDVSPQGKDVVLPIVRIAQDNDSRIVFDRYEPPRPALGGSDYLSDNVDNGLPSHFAEKHHLHDVARRVATSLRDKAQFLSEKVQRNRGVPGFRAAAGPAVDTRLRQLIQQFQMHQHDVENLRALVRPVPRLEGLIKDRSAHPFALYLALCDIVGDLAMLKGELYLPEVPAYDHLDSLASFDVLELHIRSMLDSLAQRFRILPFTRTMQGRFELSFHPADLGERLIIGAVRAKDQTVDSIQSWMTHADIATNERMPELKPKRISGPPRLPIGRVEALDLSPPALTSLFEVERSAEFIDRNDGLLIIENSASGGPTSILLYAALDSSGPEPAK